MILSFKERFVLPILSGTKIHTIRTDKTNRWKAGMKIHFATGVRTKNYYNFMMGECISTQDIRIEFRRHVTLIYVDGRNPFLWTELTKNNFFKNDGFDSLEEFIRIFKALHPVKNFTGKIIHWTNFKYHWI